jgi:hypothetical protein
MTVKFFAFFFFSFLVLVVIPSSARDLLFAGTKEKADSSSKLALRNDN